MKTTPLLSTLTLAFAAIFSVASHAEEKPKTMDMAKPAATAAAATAVDMTDGEVRKVSKDTQKITIKHGEIKNLEMPGMTMVFKVQDPAMLESVKSGDKIKFVVEKVDGGMVVTKIEAVK